MLRNIYGIFDVEGVWCLYFCRYDVPHGERGLYITKEKDLVSVLWDS